MKIVKFLVFLFVAIGLLCPMLAFATQPSTSQEAGGILRQQSDIERQNLYGQRIQLWPSKKKESVVTPEEEARETSSIPKMKVNEVKVEGVKLLTSEDINGVLNAKFTVGQEMTFSQMQALAGDITALYRQKGFLTSRAYVPPQLLTDGILVIKVLEGRMGEYSISGNKYFTTRQLEKKFRMKSGETFDYEKLRQSLEYINEYPDRQAKAVLIPGREPGTTDVKIQVKDEFPIHAVLEYDNWASRYLNKDRMGLTLENNNVSKHDDRLSLKFLFSGGDNLELWQGQYIYPLTQTLEAGMHFTSSETHLGREFENLGANGSADVVGIFAIQELVNTTNLNINFNTGFDLKNVRNYLLGNITSKDNVRVLRAGFDADYDDRYGRSIGSLEWDSGIPDIWSGMEDDNDPLASRTGAGGEFNKALLNLFRLQPLPSDIRYLNESYVLWKSFVQYTDDILVASEQFQIGGATSVRGYAPGEKSGDSGLYSALEWSFPLYGLSRDLKIPGREEKLYDSLRWVLFYDVGWVNLENPQAGEQKNSTLRGYGSGVRLNISRDIVIRLEVGWPDGSKSADGRRAHPWVEFDWRF